MKCHKCDSEMKNVKMITHLSSVQFLEYRKSVWDSGVRSEIAVWVCPRCGYIELQATNPEKFKEI